MVNQQSTAQRISPLAAVKRSTGPMPTTTGLLLEELPSKSMVQVFSRKGSQEQLAIKLGINESPKHAVISDAFTVMPLSLGQWMLTKPEGSDGSFCLSIKELIGEDGYVSEQSHSRVIIRVSGANARQVMQKGCRLDLHPSVASAGFCAVTIMAQVGVLIHQVDNAPTYDLHVYSGFAQSFWHWLTEASAEFGR